ncbi:hypothetical protein LSS_12257 [Leptospira santarosai serovar Shermani str. LT 821]|uniref:Uncharacterized protein n=1 Tax=Leptospira santarosai serovar Shermani str. LT 821 TaxID=758847 RepID=K8XYF7_9LEPT|nr:hypothetical protein LSS_12257 [Leptospira santarosai serovar Shermani str. LT 821]EPG83620.1 RND transporter, Hydrophobe/Amphiphile Efflux-1 (HAE1)/Heavy Metal Efflux (HME) family, permease protein [Leptospira santarosai serovar Shermani str. 1342KT]
MKILNLIIESSLRYKYFTLAAAILSLAVGVWSWIDIRKEAYSDIADTQVRLVSKFPGKATLEVEERVTMPIERVLHSIQDWIVVIPKLLQVSGIADVVTFGGLPKQFHVVTSPEKLIRYSVVSDVIEAIKSTRLRNTYDRGDLVKYTHRTVEQPCWKGSPW